MGINEKQINCGEYLEIDIIPRLGRKKNKGKRAKREYLSIPKQRNLNDKNARRYFVQLVNTNFGENDLSITLTYSDKYLPSTIAEGEKEAVNFLRRIKRAAKAKGSDDVKYILVSEYKTDSEGVPKRIHHHIIMNNVITRDEIEELWSRPKRKGQKTREKLGFVNCDRCQPNEFGLEALARYLTKQPCGKKRWSASQNLAKPYCDTREDVYTKRQVEKIIQSDDMQTFRRNYKSYDETDIDYIRKRYKDYDTPSATIVEKYKKYEITSYKPEFNEVTASWSIYLKLRKTKRKDDTHETK